MKKFGKVKLVGMLVALGVALGAAGIYTNGLPTVGPGGGYVPWNGLQPGSGVVTNTYLNELGGYETLGADTNVPAGMPPQTVSATAFQVAAIGAAAAANTVVVTSNASTNAGSVGVLNITTAAAITPGSTASVVLTDSKITATSNVQGAAYLGVASGAGAGIALTSIVVASGTATFTITNNGTSNIAAAAAAYSIVFQVQ